MGINHTIIGLGITRLFLAFCFLDNEHIGNIIHYYKQDARLFINLLKSIPVYSLLCVI